MKVSCLQENFSRGLAIVGRAVSLRSVLPVLHNILLATDQSQLKLSATDLSTSITCWIGAKIKEEGATTVPARLLVDFVNSLPPEQIDLSLVTRTQALHLKCARTEANIKVIDAQEFPLIPTGIEDRKITLQPETLRQMIEQVTFAAATDESRPILTGVLADFQEAKLTLAAADGFRLSVRSAPLIEPVPEPPSSQDPLGKVIIPARALQELGRVAAEEGEPVEMIIPSARNQVLFHLAGGALGGPIEVVSQLIEGNFPDYKQIIPTSYNTRTVVDTKEFLRAAKIALLFARDAANIVRVQMTPGEGEPGSLTLAATAAEVGDNVGQIDATIEGPAMEIAFNGRYLIDILNVIDSAQVVLETSTPSSPGVFRAVGDEDFVHVIMPMHISR